MADLEQVVANSIQLNYDEIIKLMIILTEFEDLFDDTFGEWDTDHVDIVLRPDSKTVNSKYYPVPRIMKETFRKELQRLVGILVLTPVKQSQYGTPLFIIPNK